jgi:hypothetical protein
MTTTLDPSTSAPTDAVAARSARLSAASLRNVIEPDEMFEWERLGPGQVVGDELLSVAGLGLDLSREQKAQLSREELSSMLIMGMRFEAGLIGGFGMQLAASPDITDARVAYMLHEIGEETRHSRAFARLVHELSPTARNPFDRGAADRIRNRILRASSRQPSLLNTLVLAGEEIPDLLQRLAAEHPETDPLVAAVNRYHRQEEARHLSFARMTAAELWSQTSWLERRRVRHMAPRAIGILFSSLVHPGVYGAVGLPAFKTWRAVQRTPQRVALRHAGTRPVVEALLAAGVLRRGRVPRGWRKLCGVDRNGKPVGTDIPLPA